MSATCTSLLSSLASKLVPDWSEVPRVEEGSAPWVEAKCKKIKNGEPSFHLYRDGRITFPIISAGQSAIHAIAMTALAPYYAVARFCGNVATWVSNFTGSKDTTKSLAERANFTPESGLRTLGCYLAYSYLPHLDETPVISWLSSPVTAFWPVKGSLRAFSWLRLSNFFDPNLSGFTPSAVCRLAALGTMIYFTYRPYDFKVCLHKLEGLMFEDSKAMSLAEFKELTPWGAVKAVALGEIRPSAFFGCASLGTLSDDDSIITDATVQKKIN